VQKRLSLVKAMCGGLAMLMALGVTVAQADALAFRQTPCSKLRGSGAFSDPIEIGLVTQPTQVTDCERLSSGPSFNHRYYRFTFRQDAGSEAVAGAVVRTTRTARSAVHPRLATPRGRTLLTSRRNGYWEGDPNALGRVGRFLPLSGLSAGTYILGVEKLDSPLRSTQTNPFSIVIVP
jgi:hypothetical protein